MKKSTNTHVQSLLFKEVIKSVKRLFENQTETRDKLIYVFSYFEKHESPKMEAITSQLTPGKPFKCSFAGFKSMGNDGEFLITPGSNVNDMKIYFDDRKIGNKIAEGKYAFSFKFYVNLGKFFPSVELKYLT
ncbi:MAG: hypothetical protein WCX65_05555 [bacterium]